MNHIETLRGRLALTVAHCAGMLDTVALPIWVGTLIGHYGFDPQQAGLIVTLFLGAVVLASLVLAPRFGRVPRRAVASGGFVVCALGFLAVTQSHEFAVLALWHVLCGAANGAALSVAHGTIALAKRPHRMFAIANTALGVAAVFYLGITPQIVACIGGPALFWVFGAVMVFAALVCLVAFPAVVPPAGGAGAAPAHRATGRIERPVWFGVAGIALMVVVQAMVFSFVERIGVDRRFGAPVVAGVLIALGLVNLTPAPLAALLERRLAARTVLIVAPVVQLLLAITVTSSGILWAYAAAASVIVAVMVFAHTFAFGMLAKLEPSGRALAATPAMLMTGAAVGPVLGGTLVKFFGYGSLGLAAALLGCGAVACFLQLPRARGDAAAPAAAPVRA